MDAKYKIKINQSLARPILQEPDLIEIFTERFLPANQRSMLNGMIKPRWWQCPAIHTGTPKH